MVKKKEKSALAKTKDFILGAGDTVKTVAEDLAAALGVSAGIVAAFL